MNKIIVWIGIFMLIGVYTQAQDYVSYEHDLVGNRTGRSISTVELKSDSLKAELTNNDFKSENLSEIGSSISIYPNPTYGVINIENSYESDASYFIYDNLSHLVKTGKIQKQSNQLDIIDFENGVYILLIKSNQGVDHKFKIIKQ